ncbi:hypothetical protein ACOSQ4_028880 [Xanthoceras sorbifolium]
MKDWKILQFIVDATLKFTYYKKVRNLKKGSPYSKVIHIREALEDLAVHSRCNIKVHVLQNKHWNALKNFINLVENQKNNFKPLITDQAVKIYLQQFKELLNEKGIQRQLTIPSTPQQNGVAEMRNLYVHCWKWLGR